MKAVKFLASGNWAHFRKVETNNNPLTHEIITKPALVGMIGAVLGKTRKEMKPLFPRLCKNLLFNVALKSEIKKISWGFTYRKAVDLFEKAPKQVEFLKDVSYQIILSLKNSDSEDIFEAFCIALENESAVFTPVFGLHNCPANLEFIGKTELFEKNGSFETTGFIPKENKIDFDKDSTFRIGFDKIPTFQDDFWSKPEFFKEILFPTFQTKLKANGLFYSDKEEKGWCLI